MYQLVKDFIKHLEEGLLISQKIKTIDFSEVNKIVISGLGGSGISGTLVQNLVIDRCLVPIVVNKGYHSPEFTDKQTLFIACSYSGNTEETISATKEAHAKGAKIFGITSGGKLQDFCLAHQYAFTLVPGGLPPRAAFGYAFSQIIAVVSQAPGCQNLNSELEKSIAFLKAEQEEIISESKEIAKALWKHLPVIYSEGILEGVSLRFRQQINENAKQLCWHHTIPEMNHNEIVGWTQTFNNGCVVLLYSGEESNKNQTRIDYLKNVVSKYAKVVEVYAKGNSRIEKWLYLIHLTDFISVDLASLKEVDPVEVNVIENLKVILKDV